MFRKIPRQPARTEKQVTRVAPKPAEESTTAGFYRWMFGGPATLRPVRFQFAARAVDRIQTAPARPAEGKTIDMVEPTPVARRNDDFPMLPSFGRAKRLSGLLQRFK